ncbi:MAG: hypothetical protein C1942_01300 [Prosthecochloris sp.]|uniref:SUMF1/EgtB/PvdO family nonheme iron enzyme n=1 Tax=Prosthecochloris sp. TaxID=290513 RepID=UPI0013C86808|nr:SUMF1/EgtB/PvdO family nonheme iron enzyme [Prosthecochloris sp.]NEX11333.1 hypothetical protein [Prosthecochloris sp.]
MSDIFISYAREDERRVKPIVQHLQQMGWRVFWDRNIPPGQSWDEYIEQHLEASRCVVVVWSKHSVGSRWVKAEAEEAKNRNILVPLLLDKVKLSLGFRYIQAADLTSWNHDDITHPQFRACIDAIACMVPQSGPLEPASPDVLVTPVEPPASRPQLPENFVLIRGGQFSMGSPEDEYGHQDNESLHEVKVSDFAICRYTVTVGEYLEFTEEVKINYDGGTEGDRYPLVNVSWNDAVAYCRWLSEKRGELFRLPTEAEWEYACRGGTTTPFSTGENLTTDEANYNGNYPYRNNPKGKYRKATVPVESFEPNSYGLYNMHGNVREWCGDWYGEKYYEECRKKGVVENPQGPKEGSYRVLRGGGWRYNARHCRSAYRYYVNPGYRSYGVGFRLVFVPQFKG